MWGGGGTEGFLKGGEGPNSELIFTISYILFLADGGGGGGGGGAEFLITFRSSPLPHF